MSRLKLTFTPLILTLDSSRTVLTFTEHPDHHRSRPKSSRFNSNQIDHTCNMSHGITLETFTNITTFTGSTTSPRPHPKPPDLNSNAIMSHRVLFHIFPFFRSSLFKRHLLRQRKQSYPLLTFSHFAKRSESKATCFDGYLLPVFSRNYAGLLLSRTS